MHLRDKKLLIIDRGWFADVALHCAKYCHVYYHCLRSSSFEDSQNTRIGEGFPGLTCVSSYEEILDEVDAVYFPDIYDGEKQVFLRKQGYSVCGNGTTELLELDKDLFYKELKENGLLVPPTGLITGVDNLLKWLSDKKPGDYFIKLAGRLRGDFETEEFTGKLPLQILVNHLKETLGEKTANSTEFLVQKRIGDKTNSVEIGVDGFSLSGRMPRNSILGYEGKGEFNISKVVDRPPDFIQKVLHKMEPMSKDREIMYKGKKKWVGGEAGNYSLEMRVMGGEKVYPIDDCRRAANPPTALLCKIYGQSYVQAIFDLAEGEMPVMKPEAEYGVEIMLGSLWLNGKTKLHIGCPKDAVGNWLMLKTAVREDGEYYRLPINHNHGSIVGSVYETGFTWQEAMEKALEHIDTLQIADLEYTKTAMEDAEEIVELGEKLGIDFD